MSDPTDTANLNFRWAHVLMESLVAGGVKRIVVSPGSRSTPLALAAARHPQLELRVMLDERSAAFFALGMARAAREPVTLIATSGTAVTEWLPAVTEADLSRVPLILLSADRPPELRQCGANQTIQQNNLFDASTRFTMELPLPEKALFQAASHIASRAVAAAHWPQPGPVHLNIPFREPLTPDMDCAVPEIDPLRWSQPVMQSDSSHLHEVAEKISGRNGLIVCGHELGDPLPAQEIAELAQKIGAPVLADPLSNLRCSHFGRETLITHYDSMLRSDNFVHEFRPAWVMRFGAMPVSKMLERYLSGLEDAVHIVIDPSGRWTDPVHKTTELLQADPQQLITALLVDLKPAENSWLGSWRQRQEEVAQRLSIAPPVEVMIVDTLRRILPAEGLFFSGNSLAIRQLDWFLAGRAEPLRILCNRGASGIDGNVSTLLGMAAVSTGPVVGLLGDLTLQHDIGALAEAQGMDAVILVLDNGGGAIFDYLPQSSLEEFEPLFLTPRSINLEAVSTSFGVGYRKTSLELLADDLGNLLKTRGVHLLHLQIDRQQSLNQHLHFWEQCKA